MILHLTKFDIKPVIEDLEIVFELLRYVHYQQMILFVVYVAVVIWSCLLCLL